MLVSRFHQCPGKLPVVDLCHGFTEQARQDTSTLCQLRIKQFFNFVRSIAIAEHAEYQRTKHQQTHYSDDNAFANGFHALLSIM